MSTPVPICKIARENGGTVPLDCLFGCARNCVEDDKKENPLRNGVSSFTDDRPCNRCGAPVYWAPFYDAKGETKRKLFSSSNHRPHDCSAKPNADDFDVVPE